MVGLILQLLTILGAGTCIAGLLRAGVFLCAIVAFFLGLGVFRVRRLPSWAHEAFSIKANYAVGVTDILLGAVLVTMAILTP